MSFAGEIVTLLLSGVILVYLAIYTISRCKAIVSKQAVSREDFLFEGLRPVDSLASNMGAAFSLTYLGATAIYAHLYGIGFLLYSALGFLCAGFIATRLINLDSRLNTKGPQVLFTHLKRQYGQSGFRIIAGIYSVIYFGLLVEEIAVGRLVMNLLLPQSRAVAAALLATLLLSVLSYLNWGGFKAILISDFAQLKLLVVFLVVLILVLVGANPISLELQQSSHRSLFAGTSVLFLGLLLFVPWLSCAPDFYSRLNYRREEKHAYFSKREFIVGSLIAMFFVYGLAGLVGASLPPTFAIDQTPTGFAEAGIAIIGSSVSRVGTIVFFASIFCMLFTTIDTLLITLLQSVDQASFLSNWAHRPSALLLIAAAVAGLLVPAKSISAYGLFIGALLIIPMFPLLGILSQRVRNLLPQDQSYLTASLILSVIAFAFVGPILETEYSLHHLVGLVVFIPTATCAVVASIAESLRRKVKWRR